MRFEVTKAKNNRDTEIIVGVVIIFMGLSKWFGTDVEVFSSDYWNDIHRWIDSLFFVGIGVYICWSSYQNRKVILGDYLEIDSNAFEYQQRGDKYKITAAELRRIDIKNRQIEWLTLDHRSGVFSLKDYRGRRLKKEIKEAFQSLQKQIISP
jgi:hypothetical protein